jgi:Ca-activated chloride channel family protein
VAVSLSTFSAGAQSAPPAQPQPGPPVAGVPTFAVRSALVVLSATAVDRKGRPVHDLRAGELTVYEEGRPQPLLRFSQARDLKARVLLLVDASGSMNTELQTTSTRMAAWQMLAALDPGDEAALAAFDSDYWTAVPFTRDRERLRRGLEGIQPFGSTALHDALDRGASEIAGQGEGRRAIVVITDGVDTASQKTSDDVIARSKALDVPIYAVSVVSPLDDPRSDLFTGDERPAAAAQGQAGLARFAALSGGAAFVVSDFRGLHEAARRIAGELKHQSRLGFDPPAGPQRFRRVEVRAKRKGVLVRTRSGYVPLS